jgi:outer membrane receptor protein involved in Fe transport
MKSRRADIFPVLAIIAGGSFGALVTGALMLRASDVEVRMPQVVVTPNVAVRSEIRVMSRQREAREVRISTDAITVSPDGQWAARRIDGNATAVLRVEVENRPLIYVDGVLVETTVFEQIDPNDVESVEVIKGPDVATRYGSEASAGVIQITTKAAESNVR